MKGFKIPKEIYKYIEYELYHYGEYKKELELEKERILESSGSVMDGMPRGNVGRFRGLFRTIMVSWNLN